MGGSFCYSHCSKERWFPVWDHLIAPTSVISLSIQCNNCVTQRSISMTKANQLIKKKDWRPHTVVCTYTPGTQEVKAEERSRVWGQPVYIASSSIVRVTQLELFSKIGTRKEEKAREEEEEERERKEEAAKKQNNVQQCPLSTLTHICFSVSLPLTKIVHISIPSSSLLVSVLFTWNSFFPHALQKWLLPRSVIASGFPKSVDCS